MLNKASVPNQQQLKNTVSSVFFSGIMKNLG